MKLRKGVRPRGASINKDAYPLWGPLDWRPAQEAQRTCVAGPHGGVITADEDWCLSDSPHILSGDVTVAPGAVLTVEPGVTVKGNKGVELKVRGGLQAVGTVARPITFTSALDSGPGQWSGIVFDGSAALTTGGGTGYLRHATVRYAGDDSSLGLVGSGIAVRNVVSGQVRLENSRVSDVRSGLGRNDYGLWVMDGRVAVSSTIFSNIGGNGGYDVPLYISGATSALTMTGNVFAGNIRNRVLLAPGAMMAADATLASQTGLEAYELENDFVVPAGKTLTVEPGVTVVARDNVELKVQGHLAAVGTVARPITFTSTLDNGPGQWSGLVFDGSAALTTGGGTGHLRHATVRYAGDDSSLGLVGSGIGVRNVVSGEVRLENSRVSDVRSGLGRNDYGLWVMDSRVAVSSTIFSNIGGNGGNDAALYISGGNQATLHNNVLMDNTGSGLHVAAGAQVTPKHTTIARNDGSGIQVDDGAVASLANTIVARNGIGVNVAAGGVLTLTRTLWDRNTTDVIGAVNEVGRLEGPAFFDLDGYHLTRYSAALGQGLDVGVLEDIDGEARPLPAGTLPDLGADEHPATLGQDTVAEKTALPPRWIFEPGSATGNGSGRLQQRYLIRYYYGSPDPNPPAVTVQVTDTLPAELTLEVEEHYPPMTFQQQASLLTWQTQQPVVAGQAGQIELTTFDDDPEPGQPLTNTAKVVIGAQHFLLEATTQVPVVAPLIVFPGNGEICPDPTGNGVVEVRGAAQAGLTIKVYEDGATVAQTTAAANGQFTVTYTSTLVGVSPVDLAAEACLPDDPDTCSSLSQVHLTPQQSFWCPQHSTWEGTVRGRPVVYRFRDATGHFSTQNWVIPGAFGFLNTQLHLYACNCPSYSGTTDPPSSIWVIADGVRYDPVNVSFPWYEFNITGSAHDVVFWAQCGDNLLSSLGQVLIDPDGYIFDVTQGFDPISPTLHAVQGVTVTAMVSMTEWGGWVPWPAHLYNNQQNPQVTGEDGYFAFFTPPGFYYLQVDGKDGYQPWRSPVIQVITEIVHANVPYTPWPVTEVTTVTLSREGPEPAAVTVPVGSAVAWIVEADGLVPPERLLLWIENPELRPLSDLDPITSTLGWDGGMMAPGRYYRREMASAGLFGYTDGQGHRGEICVTPAQDVNANGVVDMLDIQVVAQAWYTSDSALSMDGDGDVDVVDIMLVAASWGWSCH